MWLRSNWLSLGKPVMDLIGRLNSFEMWRIYTNKKILILINDWQWGKRIGIFWGTWASKGKITFSNYLIVRRAPCITTPRSCTSIESRPSHAQDSTAVDNHSHTDLIISQVFIKEILLYTYYKVTPIVRRMRTAHCSTRFSMHHNPKACSGICRPDQLC